MARSPARASSVVRLFDAHCHLQDPCVFAAVPSPSRIGWIGSGGSSPAETPEAAVGEIGLDKGSHGKTNDFGEWAR
ncbi:hypothetical protein GUJ93_ZPchr0014g46570 [Zizania palustris]|uniref:Uncharacterized protein n=1 Tax=Zizania palustris TaxID=103762 RepID=A0A8J5THU3_ZIZPA|nr:hypothetical protein GUJ93_ZPchr0014g46570 [Zizania palustris]